MTASLTPADLDELSALEKAATPIPMLLFCPVCHAQHVDEASQAWDNPPHRSHLCHSCGCVWRPADVPTIGVAAVQTAGKVDTWTPGPSTNAAARRGVEMGWQPIETAPKDGTRVDLWVHWPEHDRWDRTADAYWNGRCWQMGQFNEGQFMYPPKITHWRPLPAAPTQGETA